jgi:DNA-binding CsgD family transcriptional regulator
MTGSSFDSVEIPWAYAAEVMDCFRIGVILAGAGGRVLAANRPAHEIASLKDGLEFSRGLLRTALPDETSVLRNSIALGRAPMFLSLSRPSGNRPLTVLVRSLSQDCDASSSDLPVAAVFVSDPDRRLELNPAGVADLYGLTPAEAAVASLVGVGRPVLEAARRLGVQANTVRVQLKQVYAKTGTRRQSALVYLIMTGPAHLHLG